MQMNADQKDAIIRSLAKQIVREFYDRLYDPDYEIADSLSEAVDVVLSHVSEEGRAVVFSTIYEAYIEGTDSLRTREELDGIVSHGVEQLWESSNG